MIDFDEYNTNESKKNGPGFGAVANHLQISVAHHNIYFLILQQGRAGWQGTLRHVDTELYLLQQAEGENHWVLALQGRFQGQFTG